MENIVKFEPLFDSSERFQLPLEAVQEIRASALEVILSEGNAKQDTIRDVSEHTMVVVRSMLSHPSTVRGRITRLLAAVGYDICGDPVLLVTAMISEWFREVSPYMTRNVNDDPASDNGTRSGNLGLLAMLLTMQNWNTEEGCDNLKLRDAVFVANTVTTVVCGAYLIYRGFGPALGKSWDRSVTFAPPSVSIWVFLKSAWQVARTHGKWADCGPGGRFGANSEEMRMRRDGRRILVQIGRLDWEYPAYWHPGKQVPGSAWNKFLKNKNQPVFTKANEPNVGSQIMYRFPSTAIKFAQVFEGLYHHIYEGMDRRGFARILLDEDGSGQQHCQLASATGVLYANSEIDEEDATEMYNVIQDYLDVVPLAYRPITDLRGNLTLSFMTATARALRFDTEPEPIDEDLWMMVFGGIEAGEVFQ